MDDPKIIEYQQKGYLDQSKLIGYDFFGNEVFKGDEVIVLDDDVFLVDEVMYQLKEYLILKGASLLEANESFL